MIFQTPPSIFDKHVHHKEVPHYKTPSVRSHLRRQFSGSEKSVSCPHQIRHFKK